MKRLQGREECVKALSSLSKCRRLAREDRSKAMRSEEPLTLSGLQVVSGLQGTRRRKFRRKTGFACGR